MSSAVGRREPPTHQQRNAPRPLPKSGPWAATALAPCQCAAEWERLETAALEEDGSYHKCGESSARSPSSRRPGPWRAGPKVCDGQGCAFDSAWVSRGCSGPHSKCGRATRACVLPRALFLAPQPPLSVGASPRPLLSLPHREPRVVQPTHQQPEPASARPPRDLWTTPLRPLLTPSTTGAADPSLFATPACARGAGKESCALTCMQ